ncbi:phage minor head protein [Pseudooceanicola atlanticus]|uniref:phage minor head protein n=1 Tax=Pseudooceanicola atlanticus TaxID=1461694 RepID=UPI0006934781|nr:phage minor head protein [Pseudooceanicola atlanticus]
MPRDTRRRFLEALAPHLTQIENAFIEAFADMRSAAAQRTLEEIVQRYTETGDIEAAILDMRAAIGFAARGFYAPLDRAHSNAFIAGGLYQQGLLPKRALNTAPKLVVRFDGFHERAIETTRRLAGRLITEISESVETVIRETLVEARETNRSYRATTLDLIGRTEGNQRKGGLIGLHSRQAAAVRKARVELEALDSCYFRRAKRDRRFDGTVRKAIKEGRPLSQADVDKITGRYSDRLLRLRADMIARTEGNGAMNAGRHEATQQMIDSGKVPVEAITRIWDSTPGPRTRDSHRAMQGQEVRWQAKFQSPVTGAFLAHPHDPEAPAAETVNCRCSERIRIDWAMVAS